MKYKLTITNRITGEEIDTMVYNHYPTKEAQDIVLADYWVNVKIDRI